MNKFNFYYRIIFLYILFISCDKSSNDKNIPGCTDPDACNFDINAVLDNGSCIKPGDVDSEYENFCNCFGDTLDCTGLLCSDISNVANDGCGICRNLNDELWNSSCSGCMDALAFNFNPEATVNDPANCVYNSFADTTMWELIWNDEFNNPYIDNSKWNFENWGPGVVNNELQAYTDRSINAYIEDSCLVIRALYEQYNGASYTSARLNTAGKVNFLYGKIDMFQIMK